MSGSCIAIFRRSYATKTKLTTIFNEDVRQMILREEIKARKHPGRCSINAKPLPDDLISAVLKTIKAGGQLKNVMSDGQLLLNYLYSRHSPTEQNELMEKKQQNRVELEKKCRLKFGVSDYSENMSEEQQIKFERFINNRVERLVAQRTYNWKPIDYNNKHVCHQYLLSRIAPEYNVIKTLFSDLQQRDPNFAPESLFDFGSGIGTVTLNAKDFWGKSLKEYYCVDTSSTMNDLAKLILQEGNPNNEDILPKGLFYRQFLPASPKLKFDLVVSAYTMFELPDIKTRFETLLNLWNKTKKYIVLVEMGTRAGFNLINEARDLLLEISSQNSTKSHVFSPCPHEHSCPRYDTDDTPCNFEVSYFSPNIAQQSVLKREHFSYVIIKKG
ncbi:methyltransferase-like protein 17, mitochondrial [Aphis craccivora]|uniref:Methyltransferase-like protein 17, mitochondrial n=1 Tax=Aphis craccivora TaxID=307492 RepID=A0A6G0ZAP0_APHCR|nr:methyltransferase-like protein 17, mitochondrial [Aphis craccivora]